ncbi:hypothetical protein JCM10212_005532 [Sporobolomyces blumeae]
MNSLYTLALRQSTSLTSDLTSLEHLYQNPASTPANTSALHGQINASLAAFDRTIDDYDSMARREIVDVKREKATSRVARFREDYSNLRKQYERIKNQGIAARTTQDRADLFSSTSNPSASASSFSASTASGSATSRPRPAGQDTTTINIGAASSNPYSNGPSFRSGAPSSSAYGSGGGGGFQQSLYDNPRTNAALSEHDFLSSTSSTLDAYLAQGQAVLSNLTTQREVMKGTKKRLLNAANTLGLSRETITFVERRTKGDWYIMVGGGVGTLVCFGLILKYFG